MYFGYESMYFGYESSKESKLEHKMKKERLARVRREREEAAEQELCGEATGHHYPYNEAGYVFERECSICGYQESLRIRRRRTGAPVESPQATDES